MSGFQPLTDAGLLQWASAASTQVTATPTLFGLTAPIATGFAAAVSSFSDALAASTNESTRTKGTVAAKNTARAGLRAQITMVAALVQAHPGITDQQLSDLGLTVRSRSRTPVNPPGLAPLATVLSVTGRVAKYRVSDASAPNTRRRPPNAEGLTVLGFVGNEPPAPNEVGWIIMGQTGRNEFQVDFGTSVVPGTPCWMACYWYSRRGASSPACDPVKVFLAIGQNGQTAKTKDSADPDEPVEEFKFKKAA